MTDDNEGMETPTMRFWAKMCVQTGKTDKVVLDFTNSDHLAVVKNLLDFQNEDCEIIVRPRQRKLGDVEPEGRPHAAGWDKGSNTPIIDGQTAISLAGEGDPLYQIGSAVMGMTDEDVRDNCEDAGIAFSAETPMPELREMLAQHLAEAAGLRPVAERMAEEDVVPFKPTPDELAEEEIVEYEYEIVDDASPEPQEAAGDALTAEVVAEAIEALLPDADEKATMFARVRKYAPDTLSKLTKGGVKLGLSKTPEGHYKLQVEGASDDDTALALGVAFFRPAAAGTITIAPDRRTFLIPMETFDAAEKEGAGSPAPL